MRDQGRYPQLLFSATAFLGSFLLFQLELLAGSAVLPLFGGGYYVWTVCLLFYQAVLVAGYAYALLLSERLPGRRLLSLHLALLAAALALFSGRFHGQVLAAPIGDLLARLALFIGLPFLVLSASTTLCHRLLAETGSRSPFRVFAWSNAGSLAGMLSFSLLVEPRLAAPQTVHLWRWLFGGYILLLLAARAAFTYSPAPPTPPAGTERPRWALWLALPAATSAMLAAVTSYQSSATASMPLTWMIPLSAYLFSYALLFSGREFRTGTLRFFLFGLLAVLLFLLWRMQAPVSTALVALLNWALLFVCVAAHRELYGARPRDPALAPRFYLAMGLGGVLGTALVTPAGALRFGYGFADLYIAAAALIGAMSYAAGRQKGFGGRAALASLLLLGAIVWGGAKVSGESTVFALRNFYGMYRVEEDRAAGIRRFVHGATVHGIQRISGGAEGQATTYYAAGSPISEVLNSFPAERVGAVGLGIGVSCADAKPGTEWTFYELDPDVEMIASKYFSFLPRCRAKVSVITGDARVNLAKAPPGCYDLLYLDAFTGGAVPFHLLTKEALELYKEKLKPGGLMVFHVSANFLDISPVIAMSAEAAGLRSLYKEISYDPSDPARLSSEWLAVTDDPSHLRTLRASGWTAASVPQGWRVWTDDYRDVLKALKFRPGPLRP